MAVTRGKVALYLSPRDCWSYGVVRECDDVACTAVLEPLDDPLPGAPTEPCTVPWDAVHLLESADAALQAAVAPHDLSKIGDPHEGMLLQALRRRHHQPGAPGSAVGTEIHVNVGRAAAPTQSDVAAFLDASRRLLPAQLRARPPSLVGVAHEAYTCMLSNRTSQSLVLKGDSGSGKTAAKTALLEALLCVAEARAGGGGGGETAASARVRARARAAELLLSTFGSAATERSPQASRCATFTQVLFDADGRATGVSYTLLHVDSSRAVRGGAGAGTDRACRALYALRASKEAQKIFNLSPDASSRASYPLLQPVGGGSAAEVAEAAAAAAADAAADFASASEAMKELGFADAEKWGLWGVVAGLLHLSAVVFAADEEGAQDGVAAAAAADADVDAPTQPQPQPPPDVKAAFLSTPERKASFKLAAYCFGVSAADLERLVFPAAACASAASVRALAEAVCSSLHTALFVHLVARCNAALVPPSPPPTAEEAEQGGGGGVGGGDHFSWIGLFDYAGFRQETGDAAAADAAAAPASAGCSFEALCANATGDAVQRLFNELVVEDPLETAREEGVSAGAGDHVDRNLIRHNVDTCRLLCGDALGGGLLADVDAHRHACDAAADDGHRLLATLSDRHGCHPGFVRHALAEPTAFRVRHTAAEVAYRADGFACAVPPSRPPPGLAAAFRSSRDKVAAALFADDAAGGGGQHPAGDATSLMAKLAELFAVVRQTRVLWVVCLGASLRPAAAPAALQPASSTTAAATAVAAAVTPSAPFDKAFVLAQLKASGLCEAITLKRHTYRFALDKAEFLALYKKALAPPKAAATATAAAGAEGGNNEQPPASVDDTIESILAQVGEKVVVGGGTTTTTTTTADPSTTAATAAAAPAAAAATASDPAAAASTLGRSIVRRERDWAVGHRSLVFFSERAATSLQDLRRRKLAQCARVIQRFAATRLSRAEVQDAQLRSYEGVLRDVARSLQVRAALVTVHDKSRRAVTTTEGDSRRRLELSLISTNREHEETAWALRQLELERRAAAEAERAQRDKARRMQRLQAQEVHLRHQRAEVDQLKAAMREMRLEQDADDAAAAAASPFARHSGRATYNIRSAELLGHAAEAERTRGASPVFRDPAMLACSASPTRARSRSGSRSRSCEGGGGGGVNINAAVREGISDALAAQAERGHAERVRRLADEQGKKERADKKRVRQVDAARRAAARQSAEHAAALARHDAKEERRRRGAAGVAVGQQLRRQLAATDLRVHKARQKREMLRMEELRRAEERAALSAAHHETAEAWHAAVAAVADRAREEGRGRNAAAHVEASGCRRAAEEDARRTAYESARANLLRDAAVDEAVGHHGRAVGQQRHAAAGNRRLLEEAEGEFVAEVRRRGGAARAEEARLKEKRAKAVEKTSRMLAEDLVVAARYQGGGDGARGKAVPSPPAEAALRSVSLLGTPAAAAAAAAGSGGKAEQRRGVPPSISEGSYLRLLGGGVERQSLAASAAVHADPIHAVSPPGTLCYKAVGWK